METNYASLTLASGTVVTYLVQADGTRLVVTPDYLKGKYLVQTSNGWKVA